MSILLPDEPGLLVQTIQSNSSTLTLYLEATQEAVMCPLCAQLTTKIQSLYQPKLADLSWANYKLQLILQVRRFFCLNLECARQIFCERLPKLTQAYARRTNRLRERLLDLALALGGRPAASLADKQDLKVSRSSFLRLLINQVLPTHPTPRVLGVDDFALRKGRRYATLLVDLEKQCPIEVLADRTTETLAKWLAEHVGVEIVSRDRNRGYAKAVRQSAPNAVQVADRFHILVRRISACWIPFGEGRS